MVAQNPSHSALRKRVAAFPDTPGVYLFRDAEHRLLYVGKALSLRKRTTSYFRREAALSPRIAKMVQLIHDCEFRETASETEALILESELIKEHHPRYNVVFRDDKSYPMLKLTHEPYPRLIVTRRKPKDSGLYFGPYPDAALMHEAVRFLRRVFPLRTCRRFPQSPCLEYHLGQCLAPCAGYINEARYNRIVRDLVAFLEGKRDKLLNELSRRMQQASRRRHFEEAARLRDQIQALTSVIVAKEKSLTAGPLEQLQAALKLPRIPQRIEAFDISNIFGEAAVGSMVVFAGGRPYKAHYRRFTIESVPGIDDFKMMQEVVHRRYSGSLASSLPKPDLILVDGGKGQLGAACEVLAELKLPIPAIGLAKRFEQIFLPGFATPVMLLPTSPVLHLLQHIRDEAHRFAITFHRHIRRKAVRASVLDGFAGIGPVRKQRLLRHFGTVSAVGSAPAGEIAHAGRFSKALAEKIKEELNETKKS